VVSLHSNTWAFVVHAHAHVHVHVAPWFFFTFCFCLSSFSCLALAHQTDADASAMMKLSFFVLAAAAAMLTADARRPVQTFTIGWSAAPARGRLSRAATSAPTPTRLPLI